MVPTLWPAGTTRGLASQPVNDVTTTNNNNHDNGHKNTTLAVWDNHDNHNLNRRRQRLEKGLLWL